MQEAHGNAKGQRPEDMDIQDTLRVSGHSECPHAKRSVMSRAENLKGATREAATVLDLMQRGFEVFRPTSTASCDLIALKYGITLRIEVTGGRRASESGPITQHSSSGGRSLDCRLFDVLVRHIETGEVLYLPSMHLKESAATLDLPLRWIPSKYTTKKTLSRTQQMEKE